jgi:catechol 2,3-dioxygenase-like lactoylglutathione lyase family enzyme
LKPATLTHIAIRSQDLASSTDFYRRYAGLEPIHERVDQGIRVVWMGAKARDPGFPEFAVVLLEMPFERPPEPSANDHLGFAVASRAEVDRIGALGRADGCLKYGPADAGPIVGYIVLVRDPSGNTCEFSHGQSLGPR